MFEVASLFIYKAAIFLGVLTLLVFFHELGHYMCARWFNVRVETFSIGFGRELFGWDDKHGTRWKVSWIPLGGYVKMFGFHHLGEDAEPLSDEEKKVAFDYKKLWQKSIIVLGGPVANFLLAIVFFFILFVGIGDRQIDPLIGSVQEKSYAAEIGLQAGDTVLKIADQEVSSYTDIFEILSLKRTDPVVWVVDRNQSQIELLQQNPTIDLKKLGISPFTPPVIEQLITGSAAEKAGMQQKDVLLAIDGQNVFSFDDVRRIVERNPAKELEFSVERAGNELSFTVLIDQKMRKIDGKDVAFGFLGVQPQAPGKFNQLGMLPAVNEAVWRTVEVTQNTLKAVGQMISGTRSTEELGGPIRIAQIAGQVAELGLASILLFMAVISINLGLINLFPIPLLDGGHLLFYSLEAILRRPLNEKFIMMLMNLGLIFIISLFAFTTFNDIMRFEGVKNLIDSLFGN